MLSLQMAVDDSSSSPSSESSSPSLMEDHRFVFVLVVDANQQQVWWPALVFADANDMFQELPLLLTTEKTMMMMMTNSDTDHIANDATAQMGIMAAVKRDLFMEFLHHVKHLPSTASLTTSTHQPVAYLLGGWLFPPGSPRTIYNCHTKPLFASAPQVTVQCCQYPGWMQACEHAMQLYQQQLVSRSSSGCSSSQDEASTIANTTTATSSTIANTTTNNNHDDNVDNHATSSNQKVAATATIHASTSGAQPAKDLSTTSTDKEVEPTTTTASTLTMEPNQFVAQVPNTSVTMLETTNNIAAGATTRTTTTTLDSTTTTAQATATAGAASLSSTTITAHSNTLLAATAKSSNDESKQPSMKECEPTDENEMATSSSKAGGGPCAVSETPLSSAAASVDEPKNKNNNNNKKMTPKKKSNNCHDPPSNNDASITSTVRRRDAAAAAFVVVTPPAPKNRNLQKRKSVSSTLPRSAKRGKRSTAKKTFELVTLSDQERQERIPKFEDVKPILVKADFMFRQGVFAFPDKDPKTNPFAVLGRDYFTTVDAFRSNLCQFGLFNDPRWSDEEREMLHTWIRYNIVTSLKQGDEVPVLEALEGKEAWAMLQELGYDYNYGGYLKPNIGRDQVNDAPGPLRNKFGDRIGREGLYAHLARFGLPDNTNALDGADLLLLELFLASGDDPETFERLCAEDDSIELRRGLSRNAAVTPSVSGSTKKRGSGERAIQKRKTLSCRGSGSSLARRSLLA